MKKIISSLVILGCALMPIAAQGDIVSTLPLQSNPATSTPIVTSPLSCFNFTRTLNKNSTSYDVRALQFALQKEGFDIPVSEYGVYGAATLSGVNSFQLKYASEILMGDAPTGAVGRKTRQKLNSLYGCDVVSTATATTQPAMTVPTNVSLVIKNVALDANGVTAVFCNQSQTAIPVFPARLRLNGIVRDFNVTGATGAGACDTVTFPYGTWGLTYDAGVTYGVVTALDPNNMYKKSSLSFPLSATTTLVVPAVAGAHLSIRGIFLKSNGLQGTYCNLGDSDLTSFPVRVIMNGFSKDFDIPGVYAHGKCTSVTWTYDSWNVSSAPGTLINATVNIDPNNIIRESNEFDNSASITGVL